MSRSAHRRIAATLLQAGALAGAANLHAQEAPPAESATAKPPLEEVVVTGSLLKRSQYAQTSPLQILDRDDFATFAPNTVNGIAKNLTISGGADFQNETGNLIGMSQLNIRCLGLGSSLVLINGRRGGVSTTADGGGNQFFDHTASSSRH